jgi:glutamate dehydrogenase
MAIHPLLKQAKKLLGSNDHQKFLLELFEDVPHEDLELMTPDALARAAKIHFELLSKKTGEKPLIHIENMTLGEEEKPRATIDVINNDMAFLVDSIAAEISRHNRLIQILVHPILSRGKGKNKTHTSHIHIELRSSLPEALIRTLKADLERVSLDVSFATRDWLKMREKLRSCQKALSKAPGKYEDDAIEEYLYFLEYLYRDNFTLLGVREYKFSERKGEVVSQIVHGSSLGLLSNEVKPVYINENKEGLRPGQQKLRRELEPVSVSKVNKLSTVHRPVPLDAIAVKQFDDKGKVIGECLFIGLFTSVTYSRSIQDIPYLRRKTEQVMRMSGFAPRSHDFKALRHILERYPRDELFQIDEKDMLEKGLSILRLQERPRIALYTRPDPFGRYVSCLVYVPRERYDTQLRVKIQSILEDELQGTCGNFYTSLDDSPLARVMYIVYVGQKKTPEYNPHEIEEKLQAAGRAWGERLYDAMAALEKEGGDSPDLTIIQKYGEAFPVSYQQHYSGKQAIYDIEKVEQVLDQNSIAIDLYHSHDCSEKQMRLKLYHPDAPIMLSAVLPVLENMGLLVDSELPFKISPGGDNRNVWIHDFLLLRESEESPVLISEIKDVFEEAIRRVWQNEMDNDGLNRLVLSAKMNWREVMILRAYLRYMRQTSQPYSTRFLEQSLTSHPNISKHIIDLFMALHDPEQKEEGDILAAGCSVAIDHELETVLSLDEDKVLRSIVGLVEATLRTNYFQKGKDGQPKNYLSLKFDSRKINELPQPRPYREIFVYSRRVEGVHLRGDKIARGGIRWSDRFEDFRTEVLGLMKAQQVKNAVIVPMGAKGGFIVKNPPADGSREALREEGVECYKIFIRGLLDITDNRKGKRVVRPKGVVCRDEPDPYLVVAADKGTATFSDIANELSNEYSFWLGDAFASGGSAGYDHKKMGITARGAWESVKRHFRELNHDTQSQNFDVIGVGDMSGDVFGNGMLLSRNICLVGAFNHLHIFCDPNPDPEKSFKERQKLFNEVKGWDQYNTKKLSAGGRIYNRKDKSIKLTAEIKKKFGCERDMVTPSELIQYMLRARTDLLWFGGIGTYIKASSETHADVGDKGNDQLRVNAKDIRAKVIGEGANLAITQLGRIEFAENGGMINADFIDNSGGVDSSDHEVNIKILLTEAMERDPSKISMSQRNSLLERMTEEVASLVLKNNYQQAQAISLMEIHAPKQLAVHSRFIKDLEKHEGLNRKLEGLPDEEEIEKRIREGRGLNSPELATLQCYAKITLTRDLLATDIPDQPEMNERLLNYFPTPMRTKFKSDIFHHRLKREIIATTLATGIVNRMGPTFVKTLMNKTGVSSADVARAYVIVREIFGLRALWDEVEALDNKVLATVQLKAMRDISRLAERETIWFLTRLGRMPDIASDIRAFKSGIDDLREKIMEAAPLELRHNIESRISSNISDGFSKNLARNIALIPTMGAACDIVRISQTQKTDIAVTAQTYFEIGDHFYMNWLRRQARYMNTDDKWSSEALSGIVEQLNTCQAGMTIRILKDIGERKLRDFQKKGKIVSGWVDTHASEARLIESFLADARRAGTLDLSMLVIAEQRLRSLYGG